MKKTLKDIVAEGKILEEYGSDCFITVTPAPNIDRIRFSVIKLGTSGKDHSDFYMTTDDMISFCRELTSSSKDALRKFQADKDSKYPKAYSFVTGVDGSKKLDIGGGVKGIRIHMGVPINKKMDHKNLAISYNSLVNMAEVFQYIYGLKPCSHYMASLVNSFWKYNENASANYNLSEQDDSISNMDERLDEETSEESTNSEIDSSTPAKVVTMFATSVPVKTDRGFEFSARYCKEDNTQGEKDYTVVIKRDAAISKDEYQRLVENTKNHKFERISFEYEYDKSTDVTYLLRFALPA